MIKAWKFFWISLWSILITFIFTKNVIKYRKEKILWNLSKSLLDTAVIVLSAVFLPPFLIAMNVAWVVSHFTNKWIKVTVGIVSGILFGLISGYAMEVLIILGIFAVDKKTGPDNGILKRWKQTEDQTTSWVA